MPLAARPHIAYLKGIKVGIYCCAEHEFSIATENTPGANPYDPLVSFDSVRELKKRSDIVIVLYHGGKEHFRYPSPQLQRIFHKFADSGANLVIAQHTHCIGCWEDYQGAALVYGQGNFIFDSKDNEYWQTNLLVQLNIDETSKQIDIKWIPCIKQKNTVCLASPRQAKEILAAFYNRSQQILRTGFIQDNYQHFADTALNSYLRVCSGYWGRTLCARILNKILKDSLFIRIYKQKDLLHIQNILECEAHRETFLQSIKSREK